QRTQGGRIRARRLRRSTARRHALAPARQEGVARRALELNPRGGIAKSRRRTREFRLTTPPLPLTLRTLARRGCHPVGSTLGWLLEEPDTGSDGLRSVFENRIVCGSAGPATRPDSTGPIHDSRARGLAGSRVPQLRTTNWICQQIRFGQVQTGEF